MNCIIYCWHGNFFFQIYRQIIIITVQQPRVELRYGEIYEAELMIFYLQTDPRETVTERFLRKFRILFLTIGLKKFLPGPH